MSLVLRIDVDKSYGRATFIQKVASKIAESYWLPSIESLGYLHDLKAFLLFLSEEDIKAHIYFRICSLPPQSWIEGNILEGHKLGLHAEDTRNIDTFKNELDDARKHLNPMNISSFTKHGSGNWKSGRNHYPPYEPDKYLHWAEELEIPFLFGNKEDINEPSASYGEYKHFPGAFWIDRPYTDYSALQQVVNQAKEDDVVVLIHCADFLAIEQVEKGMRQLVSMARQQNVSWITH